MSVTFAGYDIQEGTPVIARDGTEVGSVVGEDHGKLLVDVEDFDRNLLLPPQAISLFDQDYVMVDLTPDWIRTGNWGDGTAQLGGTSEANRLTTDDNGKTVIDIHEEDLIAAKREIARGLVTIRKRVVTDEKTIDVPVTEEHAHVVRTDVDQPVTPGTGDLFQEQTYEMELMGEDVELEKKVRVSGQVEIDKEQVERTKTLTGTTRREEVDVEEVDYDDSTRTTRS